MTSAIGLMERILGEAFQTMKNKQPKAPLITVSGLDESRNILSSHSKVDLDSCEGGFSDEEDTEKTPHEQIMKSYCAQSLKSQVIANFKQ